MSAPGSLVARSQLAAMGVKTENLERLRPATFHLKSDPHGAVQHGLIAEKVEKVYPELVGRDEAGQIQGVRYDALIASWRPVPSQVKSRMSLATSI